MPTIEELQCEKKKLYNEVKVAHNKMEHARNIFHLMEQKYYRKKSAFEKCDYELAMVDGRYKVEPPSDSRKTKTVALGPAEILLTLNKDQLARICDTLGVDVDVEEE
uniref:Uncharacterized protein n=1 Tax=viral metagenome TaxID=1070528 RepID=A0A6H2A4X0_9ZZZZ